MHRPISHLLPRSRWLWLLASCGLVGLAAGGTWAYAAQRHYASFLPAGTTIGTIPVGGLARDKVATKLAAAYATAMVTFDVDGRTTTYPLADTGASYNLPAIQKAVADQANLPFFWPVNKQIMLTIKLDDTKLTAFVAGFVRDQSHDRLPASFSLNHDIVMVSPGRLATTYLPAEVTPVLRNQLLTGAATVSVKPTAVTATSTPNQLAAAQTSLQQAVDAAVSLTVGGQTFASTAAERFSWLTAVEQPDGSFVITVGNDKLRQFVVAVASKVYLAPTTTSINLLDDVEQSRATGKLGASLPVDSVVASLTTALRQHQPGPVAAATVPVASPVRYLRAYTRSNLGFSLLLRDFANERHLTMGAAFRDLNGSLSANYNAGKVFVTASIFKPFLAYAILNKVEIGELSLASVQGLINPMIIRSDNDTAHQLHQIYGYTSIDPFLHAHGFGSTNINNYNAAGLVIRDKTTVASDVVSLFARLYNGELLDPGNTSYLLGLMKQQIYRQGIPKGSAPSAVADKVGFLSAWIHDAGIVYSPKGAYALAILTKGGSWGDIAELSRRVYRLYLD